MSRAHVGRVIILLAVVAGLAIALVVGTHSATRSLNPRPAGSAVL